MSVAKLAKGAEGQVLVEFEDRIAWVTINRPEKRNAISPALAAKMSETLDALETDDRCGVVVITGTGKAFHSGMDLKEFFRETDGTQVEARPGPQAISALNRAGSWPRARPRRIARVRDAVSPQTLPVSP